MSGFRPLHPQAVLLCLAVGTVLCAASSPLWMGSASETVCISLTVIGPGGGDPGSGGCAVTSSSVSSSESSVSSSSASSESSTAASSSTQASTGEEEEHGGRRYSIEQSRLRIVRLLRQWVRRNTLHAAPEPEPAWYDDAVRRLRDRGYIDDSGYLRLDEGATRAEVAKLITVSTQKSLLSAEKTSFDDAIPGLWYVPFVERAAEHGWMIGYRDCYGTRPCYFRPAAVIKLLRCSSVSFG
jgi:hypothetical protein